MERRGGLKLMDFVSRIFVLYQKNLVAPEDWFSLWRLNCALATYHSYVTQSEEYKMENKWDFLVKCDAKQVPITPCIGLGLVNEKESNSQENKSAGAGAAKDEEESSIMLSLDHHL